MDPNMVMVLTAANEYGRAADAFRLPHNRSRYVSPSTVLDDGPSRETTPAEEWIGKDTARNIADSHRIVLAFDQEVKVAGSVSFGTDPKICDLLLAPKRGRYNISYQHFRITFDHKGRLVIKDASTNGMTVSYDGQAEGERRNHFQWILFDHFKHIHVEVQMNGLAFNVHSPQRDNDTLKEEYEHNVDRFMAGAPSDIGAIGIMRLENPSVPSNAVLAFSHAPTYLNLDELGRVAFGKVCKVVNATTGDEYAGKVFFHRKGWEREIDVMKRVRHVRPLPPTSSDSEILIFEENIVRFIDFRQEPRPFLVMEYLPLGSMEDQHAANPIAVEEMMILMSQILSALAYVHGVGITYRDLKPANFLVYSPWPFLVKLSAFGLAQDGPMLQTFCAPGQYLALEVFTSSLYTNAVDMWWLAVVVLEYIYGVPQKEQLPNPAKEKVANKRTVQEWGAKWSQRLVNAAEDWDSDALINFLTTYMLRLGPIDLLSAEGL